MMADQGQGTPSTKSNKVKTVALVIALILAAIGLTLGVIAVLKHAGNKVPDLNSVTESLSKALSPAPAVQDYRISPVVLDASKCGIMDFNVDVAAGTLTVKPEAKCARLITLAELDKEKAEAKKAKTDSQAQPPAASQNPEPVKKPEQDQKIGEAWTEEAATLPVSTTPAAPPPVEPTSHRVP